MPLIVEVRHNGAWIAGPPIHPGDPDGSMSHNGPDGRQVYSFGCRGDHSLVRRSTGGADAELAGGLVREIATLGFEEIARLDAKHPTFECYIKTDRMRGSPVRTRFRHEA